MIEKGRTANRGREGRERGRGGMEVVSSPDPSPEKQKEGLVF